ncbi:MAG: hemerythrin domain-containing protein [Streptosporangiaceae bacterium]
MRGNRSKPDLTLVNLIHQSLRADAQRLPAAVTALDPGDRPGRLPGIRAFFDQYRAQLATHHDHEDELFFPALQARVGADKMHLNALAGQHEALDAALHAACDALAALADPAGGFTADRARAAGALSVMAELLAAHLSLEEETALPLTESEMPAAEYNKLEAKARKATPRPQAQFMIPWIIAHSTADQQKALYRSAPPTRLLYWLNRRRYRHLDQALTHSASQPAAASPSRPA